MLLPYWLTTNMTNKAVWRSNIPAAIEQVKEDVVKTLNTKTDEYADLVKEKLAGGYTTGSFVTGETAAEVVADYATTIDPEAAVGSDSIIALAWELGHVNLFTRKFERVEHWRDAAVELAAKGTE